MRSRSIAICPKCKGIGKQESRFVQTGEVFADVTYENCSTCDGEGRMVKEVNTVHTKISQYDVRELDRIILQGI